jgi:Ca-activated chloride channel family protein
MTFEWPLMLASLVLIPFFVVHYLAAQRKRRKYAVRFTNLELLEEVVGRGPGMRRHIPPLLYLLGAAAMLVSLARPQAVVQVPQEQAAVVLAIDVSGSMEADDLYPNRMEAAKDAARAFVDGLPQDIQVGVVSFHGSALTNVSLTRDHEQARRGIDRLYAGGSTAIGEAIFLALDQLALREADASGLEHPALIVLLSDGESKEGREPLDAARAALDAGIPVHTVGIGTRGRVVDLADGQKVSLDEVSLQAVAQATGGQYFYAAESGELTQIYSDLSSRFAWVAEQTEITALAGGMGTLLFLIGGLLSLRWFQQIP